MDFRVDEEGNPFVLEINPLPALGHDDIFNLFPQTQGSTYAAIINKIVGFACQRYGIEEKDPEGSFKTV